MTTYQIKRSYFDQDRAPDGDHIIETGLTLHEAQAHCKDPETSSRTCKSKSARAHTELYGAWFDGYEEE